MGWRPCLLPQFVSSFRGKGARIMIGRGWALASALLLAASPLAAGGVSAQDAAAPPASDFVIKGIDSYWLQRAGTEGPYTPDRACRMGVHSAGVVMDCKAAPDGALSDCSIVDERPRDMGFSQSVYVMAQRHVLMATPAPAETGPRPVRLAIPISIPPGGCH